MLRKNLNAAKPPEQSKGLGVVLALKTANRCFFSSCILTAGHYCPFFYKIKSKLKISICGALLCQYPNGDREILIFPVQLTTSRIGNHNTIPPIDPYSAESAYHYVIDILALDF